MKKKIKLSIDVEVELPSTPNFLRTDKISTIPVQDLSEKNLKKIGKAWIEELIKKSKEQPDD